METINNFYSLSDQSTAGESKLTFNNVADTLTLQVQGDASGLQLQLYGVTDITSEDFQLLTGFSADYTLVNTITANGIYTFGIEGIGRFKCVVNAITSGAVTVFAKMTRGN